MAEEKRRRRPRSDEVRGSDGAKRRPGTRDLPVASLVQRARDQLSEITGLESESVTSLRQSDDGTWKVSVELLEVSRIPEALDVIGSYEVELDERGRMLGYERVRRYARGDKDLQRSAGAD